MTDVLTESEGPVFSPKRVKFLLDQLGAAPKKSYGQNFLIDQNILKKEAEALDVSSSDIVIEIGPGLGALTGLLVEKAGRVVAIEFDEKMVRSLRETFAKYPSFEVIHADALVVDFDILMNDLARDLKPGGHIKMAGNLPYNISTQILVKLLQGEVHPERMLFAFQLEVAERLTAKPKTKDYGSLTLLTQFYTQAKKLFKISKSCFYPQPDIDTGVLSFSFRELELGIKKHEVKDFLDFIKKSFSVRRKTLKNALTNSGPFSYTGGAIEQALAFCRINEKVRAEDLDLRDFARLFHFLKEAKN